MPNLYNVLDHMDVVLGEDGLYHGDLEIGTYRGLFTEPSVANLENRARSLIYSRLWNMVEETEEGN